MSKACLKDDLYFHDGDKPDLSAIGNALVCVTWDTERRCGRCRMDTVQEFIEFNGRKSPVRIWYCCGCSTVSVVKKRPS